MNVFGIVSYNIYCNFTNYGSALQSWALYKMCNGISCGNWKTVLVDYCPDCLADKDPLNPFANMWDKDEESRRLCEMTLPAIRENYFKFDSFYKNRFEKTPACTSKDFDRVARSENLNGFICGSDTIFCINEFNGFDDGYFANYECMRGASVAYAASVGDSKFEGDDAIVLEERMKNFKAVGLRENGLVPYLMNRVTIPVKKVIDPTLLLTSTDYDTIAEKRQVDAPYLLLYARRYNAAMERYAKRIAKERNLKIVEISLRATNSQKGHIMRYDAGVEEFLSLIKYADFVVTNSFHGLIFGVQYKRPLVVFSREQAGSKISELLSLFGMEKSMFVTDAGEYERINYDVVHQRINVEREKSVEFLKKELELLCT